MNIFGKIIGVFLGYLFLGRFGAILGFFVGHIFDKGLRIHLYNIPRERTVEVQHAFFTATFSVMGHLAKADGNISRDEIRAAERIMSRLELNEERKREAIKLFNVGKEPTFDLDAVLSHLLQTCHQHRDLLRFFIEIQLEAALADGALQTEEQRILLHICQHLRFSPQEFQQLWAQQWAGQAFHQWYSGQFTQGAHSNAHRSYAYGGQQQRAYTQRRPESTLQDAYGVLGVPATATTADIKKAYRKLMNQHHPDKLASRGLPEGMVKLAKEKILQIRAAYDLIREARGFR